MTQAPVDIRQELPGDQEAIRDVEMKAFGRSAEADLVDSLRAAGAAILSLVAVTNGVLVGHILFSPGTIESGHSVVDAVALGPVAVLPDYQNRGVGSALIRQGMDACRDMGHRIVFLLGHPAYYPRFGFLKGSSRGIANEYNAEDTFMVAELLPGALDGVKGTAKYHIEFRNV